MKFIISTVFITLTSFTLVEPNVCICGSHGAKKYHYNESCRGLTACKRQITKVNLKQAQQFGLSLCGWED